MNESNDDRRHAGTDHDLLVRIHERLSTHLGIYLAFTQDSVRDRELTRARIDALEKLRDEAAGAERSTQRFITMIIACSSGLTGLVVWLMQHYLK